MGKVQSGAQSQGINVSRETKVSMADAITSDQVKYSNYNYSLASSKVIQTKRKPSMPKMPWDD